MKVGDLILYKWVLSKLRLGILIREVTPAHGKHVIPIRQWEVMWCNGDLPGHTTWIDETQLEVVSESR